MGRADYLALGDYNATCSICGSKYKASELKKHWQGWYRCVNCWEPRQPQDFVRGVADIQSVPWAQPETWTLVPGAPNLQGVAIAGIAIAGLAVAGYTLNAPVAVNPPN